MSNLKEAIENGRTSLGIELGSTRIKAVLIDESHKPIASGSYDWENQLENGIWTYSLDEVWKGLQGSYTALKEDVKKQYGAEITAIGSIGISAMMHGYLVFDKEGNQLVPFRTWRNTTTGQAAEELTELFQYNMPLRWSLSHLYQAILNGEEHLPRIDFMTTLAGYIHWKLTGRRVIGVGDASGIMPIDAETKNYYGRMLAQFNDLIGDKGYPWKVEDILPEVLCAGDAAGELTEEGAKLLDPAGSLKAGVPCCPPEGDAGTGMAATNAVAVRTGNVSAGTSIFSMVVLERPLERVYEEIDLVTTPTGAPVAMVHCNNCTNDTNAWVGVLGETARLFGAEPSAGELYTKLYEKSLEGDPDCGGVLVCNYLAGEGVTHMDAGRPMVVRTPESKFTLANLFRAQLYATMSTLKIGMDILAEEGVAIDSLTGHGGLFKTPVVGQSYMAAACNAPVTCMETAGEGGPYGMALLASYRLNRAGGESLEKFLSGKVFAGASGSTIQPDPAAVEGFNTYIRRYKALLEVEKTAVEKL